MQTNCLLKVYSRKDPCFHATLRYVWPSYLYWRLMWNHMMKVTCEFRISYAASTNVWSQCIEKVKRSSVSRRALTTLLGPHLPALRTSRTLACLFSLVVLSPVAANRARQPNHAIYFYPICIFFNCQFWSIYTPVCFCASLCEFDFKWVWGKFVLLSWSPTRPRAAQLPSGPSLPQAPTRHQFASWLTPVTNRIAPATAHCARPVTNKQIQVTAKIRIPTTQKTVRSLIAIA